MAWLLRHWDRSRYRLAMALYARTAGHRQLNAKVGLIIRWARMTRRVDLVVQVTLAAVVGWATHAWAQSNPMTATQVNVSMATAFVGAILAWEIADRMRKRYQVARGRTPSELEDMFSVRLPCALLVITNASLRRLVGQLVALGVPFKHAPCLLEIEARVLTWLLKDLSRAKLRQHDLEDRLPKHSQDSSSSPRF